MSSWPLLRDVGHVFDLAIVAVVTALIAAMLQGCGSSSTTGGPEEAFRRWNELAAKGDPTAASFVCAEPGKDEAYDSPITSYASGFPAALGAGTAEAAAVLNVNVDGTRANVDFTDPGTASTGDEEDVFVSLVKERGTWKVCRAQTTAAGGFG